MTTAGAGQASSASATPSCKPFTRFDPAKFSKPTRIDSKWYPLLPGTQFVLEGTANRGGGVAPHRVVLTVTDLTKVINGVRTVVLWDRDINEGQLSEAELAFHAQDDDGNIWNLGEYPEVFEDGKFAGAPDTWIAGVARAQAGVVVPGTPRRGTPSYLQGRAPEIEFFDCGQVTATGQKTCVPVGCYDNVLEVDEWSPLAPEDGRQRKFYAPGVGNLRIGAIGGQERETLELVEVVHLCPKALAEARAAALKLDARAYRVSRDVYGHTARAKHTLRAARCST